MQVHFKHSYVIDRDGLGQNIEYFKFNKKILVLLILKLWTSH